MRILFFLLIVSTLLSTLPAQQFINWKNYTALKNVQDVTIISDGFWSAATGGAFQYSSTSNQFTALHKSDGLQGNSLTSVIVDNSGRTWFGSVEGIIDIYNTSNNSLEVILDIYNSNQINKRINDFASAGDTIIVSTDFGVSLIDANSFLFFDTFFKFGTFPSNTRVNNTLKSGLFYVCTDQGVAIQKPGALNLSAPESWNVYSLAQGLPSNKTLKAGLFQGELIVSTDKGFSRFANNTWSNFIPNLANINISDFQISGDSILIVAQSKIYLYYNQNLSELYSSIVPLTRIEYKENFGFVCASTNGALFLNNALVGDFISPNAPPVNQFPSMSVDANSTFWSASGKDVTGVGYYTYENEFWNHYNISNTPDLPTNAVYHANTLGNTAYLGGWGFGFLEVNGDNKKLFNRANTGMQGIPQNPDFLVITGFGNDSRNNLWVLNYWSVERNTLSMRTPDSVWYHFTIPAAQNRILLGHENLVIDPYDTKWFSCADPSRLGLFYLNENKTYEDPSDDRSDYLTTVDGLNTNDIRDVAVDRRGDVWVATSLGVNIITNTSAIPTSGSSSLRISSVFTLRQQSVNAIAVDPLNQKWIGTNEGLLLVNSDGSRLIATFTSENSALLSNIIRSIAIDENKGIVYVGTDEGLTSFKTPYSKPLESFDKLVFGPNPFRIKTGEENKLNIFRLIRDTQIKILTIDGQLVTEFSSPGGFEATWNGKDKKGEFVSTGVYIIVAFDTEGNNVVTGKVAVLRE
ncbi:MAG TPA: two-component regulator propeller domain-containing protein [Ignavibacteriaceae bacterium]|nr:two-component regulator propeller domain-containing protein [Ignavibacteriaceae bacterium]